MQPVLVLAMAIGASLLPAAAHAGELDLNLGLQATTTEWPADHGGGTSLDLGYWISEHFGLKYIGKAHYATVDERVMTYLSLNAAAQHDIGSVRLVGTLGLVHQHEETRTALMEAPFSAALGIGDNIRHRAGARTGVSLAVPVFTYDRGEGYLAFDLDATMFTEDTRGPRWMTSGGISFGCTFDFARKATVAQ
ncbi:MAG: hypothetical protein H0T42_13235 [Deltaproteobacteria bacterium]|nr:hypothetical protein [Deltaproteobacteria bacterium]